MTGLNEWGIAFILWVQSLNPGLDPVFLRVNFLQTEEFFLIALPIVWWCVNKRVGAALAILFLSCDYLVRLVKIATGATRPYDLEPRIRNLDPQPDRSFPSAGMMDTTIFWAYLATQFRNRVLWAAAAVAMALIALTRVYLGVHYPIDVLASFVIGAIVLALFVRTRIVERVALSPRAALWVLAIGYPLVLALIQLNAQTAVTVGAMLGFNIGLLLEMQWVRFEPRAIWWKQAVKIALGLAVGLGLRLALKPLLPAGDVFTFVRYALIGLWFGVGAPWLFVLTRLAASSTDTPSRAQPKAVVP